MRVFAHLYPERQVFLPELLCDEALHGLVVTAIQVKPDAPATLSIQLAVLHGDCSYLAQHLAQVGSQPYPENVVIPDIIECLDNNVIRREASAQAMGLVLQNIPYLFRAEDAKIDAIVRRSFCDSPTTVISVDAL